MVVENFKNGNTKAVYDRFREKGRMMPEGLNYAPGWTESSVKYALPCVEY
jgi:hypothetical protein